MSTPVSEAGQNVLEVRAKMNESGRFVLPKELREALGVVSGDSLIFSFDGETVRVETQLQRARRAQELVRKYIPADRSLVDELIAERRKEFRREMAE